MEYKGINREEHPHWRGWKIIDDYKKISTDSRVLEVLCDNNEELQNLVKELQ